MFAYLAPETGVYFRNMAQLDAIVKDVTQHYRSNNIPVPERLDLLIQDYTCNNRPGPWCHEDGIPMAQAIKMDGRAGTMDAVLNATRTVARHILGGRLTVSSEKAEARAATCISCPNNKVIEGCRPCTMPAFTKALEFIIGGKSTSKDGDLKSCSLCKCHLRAKVWVQLKHLKADLKHNELSYYPDHCWLKTESDG